MPVCSPGVQGVTSARPIFEFPPGSSQVCERKRDAQDTNQRQDKRKSERPLPARAPPTRAPPTRNARAPATRRGRGARGAQQQPRVTLRLNSAPDKESTSTGSCYPPSNHEDFMEFSDLSEADLTNMISEPCVTSAPHITSTSTPPLFSPPTPCHVHSAIQRTQ